MSLALLSAPAEGWAGEPVRVAGSTHGGTLSDGDHFASWMRDGLVQVFDEEHGSVFAVAPPGNCRAPDTRDGPSGAESLGNGHLAFSCPETKDFRLFDLVRRVWTVIPSTDEQRRLFSADSLSVTGVGASWIAVSGDVGRHAPPLEVAVNRATGQLRSDEPSDLRLGADLDAKELWVPLCAPLRRRRNPDYDAEDGYSQRYFQPHVVGSFALDFNRADWLLLRRCGSRRSSVLSRSRWWHGSQLGGGLVTWIVQDGNQAVEGGRGGRGRVHVLELSTNRHRSWPIPGAINPNADAVHTRSRIYIDKPGSRYRVTRYEIRLHE